MTANITITITGDSAWGIRNAMERLIGVTEPVVTPAVSDVSSDTGKQGAEPQATDVVETVATVKPGRGRPKKTDVKPPEGPALNVVANISTGDERVDPEAEPELTPPTQPEPPAEEAKVFTMDDVRNAATPYIKKHTMALAQIDLQDCLEAAVGIRQISKLDPTDQAQMKKAINAFVTAGNADARFVKAAA